MGRLFSYTTGVICVIESVINYAEMITVTLIRKVKYDFFQPPHQSVDKSAHRTIMRSMYFIQKILILLSGEAISVQAVPPVLNYAGQVAVDGKDLDGYGLFKFAPVNADGTTTYWSNDGTSGNGSQPQASVTVAVNGGLYVVLLATPPSRNGAIDPAVFVQHTDAKLRVWFSDGVNGFQQLSPDRPFASVPYAFSAGTAQNILSAFAINGTFGATIQIHTEF